MVTIGILFVYSAGAGVSVFWLSLICAVIPLIFGVVFLFMPESPTYLVIKDRSQDAAKALQWLRGKNYDSSEEIAELQNEEEERKSHNLSLREAFSRRATIRAMIISFGLMFFQQLCGINAVSRKFSSLGSLKSIQYIKEASKVSLFITGNFLHQ